MGDRAGFYDRYWRRPAGPIPDADDDVQERKELLGQVLAESLATRREPAKILDAGCGSGTFAGWLRDLGYDVTGVDCAPAAVDTARQRWPAVSFNVASVEDGLPFADRYFDAVWSTEVLEHLFDVHAALSEFNRVLKDSGTLALTVPFHGLVKNLAIVLAGFDRHFNPTLSHIRFFTKVTLAECLSCAGFRPTEWHGVGRFWPVYHSLFVVARKVRPPGPPPEIVG